MNMKYIPTVWNSGLGTVGDLRREVDRLFDDFWGTPSGRSLRAVDTEWAPACDVEEDQNHYLLTLDMPGVQKDQIKMEIVDNQLTISGEKRQDQNKKTDSIFYSERRHGRFSRSFTLPSGIDADKVEANYQDGTLRVFVPKAESAKPRQIKITHGAGTGFLGRLMGKEDKTAGHIETEKVAS